MPQLEMDNDLKRNSVRKAARYDGVAEGIKDDQSERKAAGKTPMAKGVGHVLDTSKKIATNPRTRHVCDASGKSVTAKDHVVAGVTTGSVAGQKSTKVGHQNLMGQVQQQIGTAGDRAPTPVIPTTRQQHATSQVEKPDGTTTTNLCAQNNAATTAEVGGQTEDEWTVVMRSPTKRNAAPGVKNQQQHMKIPTARQTAIKVVTSPNSFEALAEEVNVGVNSLTIQDTRFMQQITPCISSSK
ncbi:hypothetical protein A4A49_13240 [Nicotiana attenuata]|uniref:Uncharacterized protein n=1 Tax=Nicotiana attenuata TaxID=49451 RepID=A0A1J6IWS0_NICAT|nr:hypothetical protein A4A49_13240 [Nicotiana attenuata]